MVLQKMKSKNAAVFLLVAVLVFSIGYHITTNYQNEWIKECDKKHGVDSWEVVEITGTKEAPRWFIGQSWKCVEK